jgi:serine/threonine protein kinase
VGSANYLSPEALRLQYGEKSDVWAFGIIAYKFYFGGLPFEGGNNLEIFKQIAEKEVPFEEGMDDEFRELLALSLRKDPKERADAVTLKGCALFKGINFSAVFSAEPPIDRKELQHGT